MNQFNIDRYTYDRVKLNILSAFPKGKDCEISATTNDLERNVSIKAVKKNGKEAVFLVFDLHAMERGFVIVRASCKPGDIDPFESDYLAHYVCKKNCDDLSGNVYGYGEKGSFLTVTRKERFESFLEINDITEIVIHLLDAIDGFRRKDIVFNEPDEDLDEVNFGDER